MSAGQISRIESGATSKPSSETLTALAEALGGSPAPLLKLAGHSDASIESELESIRKAFYEQAEVSDIISEELELSADEEFEERHAEVLFDASTRLASQRFAGVSDELAEVARAWPALTGTRRRLVLAFVADQEVLSALDRLPTAHGRYAISIELEELDEDGSDE